MAEDAAQIRSISPPEFARRMRQLSEQADNRFAFFLGAGCSISSGIPSAGELVTRHWLPALRDLQRPEQRDLETFTRRLFPGYDPKNPALIYPDVVARLFLEPEEAQREIERLCQGVYPAFGYVALARLMARYGGLFNVVLTTNFDDLVQDALHLFTRTRPLVIGHEALAGFIRPTRTRPLVVKLHGDHRLAPKNTSEELQQIEEQIARQTRSLLHDRGMIFMGYGGHDEGIRRLLESLPPEALPLGAYWCSDEPPPEGIRPWLESRQGILVHGAGDFDATMLLLTDAFGVELPTRKDFEAMFRQYRDSVRALTRRAARSRTPALREAARRAARGVLGQTGSFGSSAGHSERQEGSGSKRNGRAEDVPKGGRGRGRTAERKNKKSW